MQTPLEKESLALLLEAAILAYQMPLPIEKMQELFEEAQAPSLNELRGALSYLKEQCENRGVELLEVASGFRFQSKQDYAPWLVKLWEEKPQRYSRATLETLVLIAYRQPVTRAEIEDIRGVAVSSHIIKSLLEREWIRCVGHRDVPGKPSLYGTTKKFLDYFNLKSLNELPTLEAIQEFSEEPLQEAFDLEAKATEFESEVEPLELESSEEENLAAKDLEMEKEDPFTLPEEEPRKKSFLDLLQKLEAPAMNEECILEDE